MCDIEVGSRASEPVRVEIDSQEYGLGSYKPSVISIVDNYKVVKELYKVQLSPTVVSLTSHRETQKVRILESKVIILLSPILISIYL